MRHSFGPAFQLDVELETDARTIALVGPSGAGKSSVLAAIAGLLRPDHGRICVDGRVVFDRTEEIDLPPRERNVGLVPQESWLFPLLTVRQNLEFGRPDAPRLAVDQVAESLEIHGLLQRRPARLSGGERQRVALGRAILREPRLLLCDEPFAALDAARRDRLFDVVAALRRQLDAALIIVTHHRAEAKALAEEAFVIEDGKIVESGAPDSLQRAWPA